MKLHELRPAPGARKRTKRIGCGRGSGHGKTSTHGHKGQLARSGGKGPGFEGGQTPIYRRIPKRGFKARGRKEYCVVNVERLDANFEDGAKINADTMAAKGIIRDKNTLIKILGEGEIKKKLFIEASSFSESAKEKIQKAGGEIKKV